MLLLCLLLAGAAVIAGVLVSDKLQDAQNVRDTDALRALADLPAAPPPAEAGESALPLLDFAPLTAVNGEIIAWLTVDGTEIDYPVVQAQDNDYYLTHDAERNKNRNGALFLDYRVHPDFSDFNNVVYGHNMKSGRMFGTLERFKEKAYFDEHPTGTLYTPEKTYRLAIFAAAVVKPDAAHYGYLFRSPSEREAHLKLIADTAVCWRDIGVTEKDRLLVLSTCSYEYKDARTLIFAKIR